jgi:hypothetical protein
VWRRGALAPVRGPRVRRVSHTCIPFPVGKLCRSMATGGPVWHNVQPIVDGLRPAARRRSRKTASLGRPLGDMRDLVDIKLKGASAQFVFIQDGCPEQERIVHVDADINSWRFEFRHTY